MVIESKSAVAKWGTSGRAQEGGVIQGKRKLAGERNLCYLDVAAVVSWVNPYAKT